MTDLQHNALNRQSLILDVTSVALVVAMVVVLVPVAIAQDKETKSEDGVQPKVEMLTCNVLILDPYGNPVEGATVSCVQMSTRVGGGRFWSWSLERHGPLPRLTTKKNGIVEMPYPNYAWKNVETGAVMLLVEHPDFVETRRLLSVSDDPAEITLTHGFRIAVTAVNGKTGKRIKNDLFVVIEGPNSSASWKLAASGMLVSPMLLKFETTMRVCQFVDGQPSLFSDSIEIDPADRGRVLLKNVKLSLGTRVEGRLDESVTRPVKNGSISVSIFRKRTDQNRTWFWRDQVPIEEDGSFVFESLPSNEVLQMIPICDGWVPPKADESQLTKFFPHRLEDLDSPRPGPQLIELEGAIVEPVLKMAKATSARITVKTQGGDPIPGAKVQTWPFVTWFDGNGQILGTGHSDREFLVKTRAGGYSRERTHRFSATTGENGVAVIENLPPNTTQSIEVERSVIFKPVSESDRSVEEVDLKPGVVAELTIKMLKKRTDVLDANDSNDEGRNNDKF
jgi:hypothetical protein